jgi:hypothetical protein
LRKTPDRRVRRLRFRRTELRNLFHPGELLSQWIHELRREPHVEDGVKVTYDAGVDVLCILLSDADEPGMIMTRTANVVGIEILNASRRIPHQRSLEPALTGKLSTKL